MKRIIILPVLLFVASYSIAEITKPISAPNIKMSSAQWIKFNHPSKVFTIDVPKSWGKANQFKYDPNVFSFYPSDSSEFTVSITENLNLPKELPYSAVKMMFPTETPTNEPKRNNGAGWNSIRQDFKGMKSGKDWVWFSVFYGFGSNAIAITLSDSADKIGKHKEVFEAIMHSIVFRKK